MLGPVTTLLMPTMAVTGGVGGLHFHVLVTVKVCGLGNASTVSDGLGEKLVESHTGVPYPGAMLIGQSVAYSAGKNAGGASAKVQVVPNAPPTLAAAVPVVLVVMLLLPQFEVMR